MKRTTFSGATSQKMAGGSGFLCYPCFWVILAGMGYRENVWSRDGLAEKNRYEP
ncbi:MAG: hypothetical protein ACMUIA_01780 [bacterium]